MNLTYCLLITKSIINNQNSDIALKFAKKIISNGNKINFIFFYKDGVFNNSIYNLYKNNKKKENSWSEFSFKNNIKLYICISSAVKRGILNKIKINILNIKNFNKLNYNFKFCGLMNLLESIISCDRFIQF